MTYDALCLLGNVRCSRIVTREHLYTDVERGFGLQTATDLAAARDDDDDDDIMDCSSLERCLLG